LDQLNAFYSSYKSTINDKKLDSLGFFERNFPKIEHKIPDFLFFREGYAFIVECKSGILTEGDAAQLKEYVSFNVRSIERTIQKSVKERYRIYKYDVFLVLWEKIYKKKKDEVLEIVKDNNLNSIKILTINKGGNLKIHYGSVENCQELDELLNDGIRIPKNPKNEIYITPTIPVEGIMAYLIREFSFLVAGRRYIRVTANEIYNDWFKSYEIKFRRIRNSLRYLEKFNLLEKEGQNQYIFRSKYIGDSHRLISEFYKHDVIDLLRPPKTPKLDDYMG
jgi:hypothetical protein